MKLVRILPNVFLCERTQDNDNSIRFRVHGTGVVNLLKCDLTGKYLVDVLEPAQVAQVARPIHLTLDEGIPVRQRFYSAFPEREHLLIDRLIAPLEDEEGNRRFALGCLCRCADYENLELRMEA
jgi:hypothetical protein